MSSENGGESRAAANQEPTISSDNAVAVGETTNSTLPKKNNNQSINDCIGKHTKANQKGEELPFYEAANIIYRPGDCVYIESQRPEVPYFICSIRDIRKSKREHVFVNVTWFYRPCEVPTSVYQLLIHDRNHENGADHVLEDPAVKERELFISDSVDTYPISALRGHINILAFSEVKHKLKEYTEEEDNWFYILRYNPESRRLANTKGEIRVGSSHQVKLPKCVPLKQRAVKGMVRKCPEQMVWQPQLGDSELIMFMRASRSISSFSGYADEEGSVDRALDAISEESTTLHCMNLLHKSKYDVTRALQSLIKSPFPRKDTRKWTEDDRKFFVRGLRQYGKNFNKIRRELLPERQTKELVHYYYMWKKTPSAINSRPHKRGRRHSVLSRKTRSTKSKTSPASEFIDLSSCSEDEPDSEDSERDLSLYACRHCYSTKSPNWHHVGKDKLLVCKICREYFKKYGRMKPIECKAEPPPYIFKAAFETHDDDLSYAGRMRTRRSATPIYTTNGSVRAKIIHEIQEARLTRLMKKADSPSTTSSESSCSFKEINLDLTRKRNRDSESDDGECVDESEDIDTEMQNEDGESDAELDIKRCRFEEPDDDDTETSVDEDPDEEYDDIEELQPDEISNQETAELEPREQSTAEQQQEPLNPEQEVMHSNEQDDVVENEPMSFEDCPSSPDVPEDPELCGKVASRFRRTSDDDKNSCARCGLIYIIKRKKKEKPQTSKPAASTSNTNTKSQEEAKERARETELKPGISPPPNPSAPAHITSQFQNALRNYWRMTGDDPRTNPNFPLLWPHFNQFVQFPHEMSGHHLRPHSPVEHSVEYHSKFGHLLEVFSKHGVPIGGHGGFPGHSSHTGHTGHAGHTGHNSHAGPHGPPHPVPSHSVPPHSVAPHAVPPHVPPHSVPPHSRPMSAQGHTHPHPDMQVPGPSSVPVFPPHHSRSLNTPNIENIPRASPRPHLDPATGLPYAYGHPHLHSHLHTHTHLHLHPSDNPERHGGVPREHQPTTPNPHQMPGHPPSLGMPHESTALRHQELLHHIQQDPRMRNALLGPGGIPTREGAISPSMLHEYFRHDPAAYHVWLSQVARLHQEHMFNDPQHPSAHQNLRLLAEHEDYIRHMRSLEMDPKFKAEHERGMPPIPERGMQLAERGMPRGDQFPPYTPATYLEHIRRLHGRITPPSGPMSVKPVTIDLCED